MMMNTIIKRKNFRKVNTYIITKRWIRIGSNLPIITFQNISDKLSDQTDKIAGLSLEATNMANDTCNNVYDSATNIANIACDTAIDNAVNNAIKILKRTEKELIRESLGSVEISVSMNIGPVSVSFTRTIMGKE
jgi:hypothetical protein